jgi:NAD(P)-dependent dehydrogenase (short-subunit alcohol dehydrogenase family)
MASLDGRIAFVTGGASGIGLGIAQALVSAGSKVMLCDRDQAGLADAAASLRDSGGDVDAVVADISIKDDLSAAAARTTQRFGKLHILVNNAGVGGGGRYGAWNDATWRWMIDVNLLGVVWGVETFAPLIERHGEGGHIVNTASMAGIVPSASSPYAVTTYGVVALSEGLRRELAPRGIGVSVLCPGLVRTRVAEVERNRPERFAAQAGAPDMTAAQQAKLADIVSGGCDPAYVGALVREGIENDWAYIFTDTDYEAAVDARFAAIKQGFEQVRGRKPAG